MKARVGAGQVGNIEAKGGWLEVDGSDVAQAAQLLGPLAILGGIAAWANTQAEWANPKNTAPLGAGPIQLEWEDHTIRGILSNRIISFLCQGRKLDIPTNNIVVINSMPMPLQQHSLLRILLKDGSEYKNSEFVAGTAFKLLTSAGEQNIEPKYRNRWNPFAFSKGYKKLRIIGAPVDTVNKIIGSLPRNPR